MQQRLDFFSPRWLIAPCGIEPDQYISFTPVCSLCNVNLGVSRAGWWVKYYSNTQYDLAAVEYSGPLAAYWLTPLLEVDFRVVQTRLTHSLALKGFDAYLLARFPFINILKTGLSWPTESVFLDALNWLPFFSFTPELNDLVKAQIQEPHTQELRGAVERFFPDLSCFDSLGQIVEFDFDDWPDEDLSS